MEIEIRPPRADDATVIAAAVQESLPDLLPWMEWARPDYDEADAASWIASATQGQASGAAYEFIVEDLAGRFLGTCGLNQINPQHRFANLGYWTRTSEAGRGVAVAAVRTLREWAFANTDLVRLEIVVVVGNGRSERVAEKAGAHLEGVLKSRLILRGVATDATMYSLLRPS
jgi:ribosomal-protein-serine acetyltransferase